MQKPGQSFPRGGFGVALMVSFLALRFTRQRREAARTARWRSFLEKHTSYSVLQCLGMGREGIVFEVEHAGKTPPSESRALKLLDSRDGRGLDRLRELKGRLEEACKSRDLESWPCLPVVYDLDIIEASGHAVPFEEMELVHGSTLAQTVTGNAMAQWPLRDRLLAFDELLYGLQALSEKQINFVHIDPDNVMVTPQGQFKLIDISGFRLVGLSARKRRRIFRRLARTFLALIDDHRKDIQNGRLGEAPTELLRQLELYRDLPKGERPPAGIELFSIHELRNRIRSAFALESARED